MASVHRTPTPAAPSGSVATLAVERPRAIYGILLIVATVCLFPISDSIAKLLTADLAIVQIVWGKLFFHTIIVAPLLLARGGVALLRSRHLPLQIGRSLLLLFSMLIFVTALAFVPLAQAIAVLYVSPIFVTALSVPLLGERVGIHRWIAVAIGFTGAMIVLRPGFGVMHWASMLLLVAALASALFQISTRRLTAIDPPMTTLFFTSFAGTSLASLLVIPWWVSLSVGQWALLAAAGAVSALASYLMIRAFEHAAASVLAPIGYVEILTASIAGFLVFSDIPDRWTVAGAMVIAASGLYIARRESKLQGAETAKVRLRPPITPPPL